MKEYRLDKTVFKVKSFDEADMDNIYPDDTPYAQRLAEAYYLTSIAYQFDINNPPKLDKTYFSSRKHVSS